MLCTCASHVRRAKQQHSVGVSTTHSSDARASCVAMKADPTYPKSAPIACKRAVGRR